MIDEASDGSPSPARTCRRFWRLATSASTALALGLLRQAGERGRDEILGQPHGALRFGAGSPARLKDDMARVDDKPEREQRSENEIEPRAQRDRTPHPSHAFPASPLILPALPVNAGTELRERARHGALGSPWKVQAVAGSHRRRPSDRHLRMPGASGDGSGRRGHRGAGRRVGLRRLFQSQARRRGDRHQSAGTSRGSSFCAASSSAAPEARLIVFSMNDDPVVAARAIEAGAKGYIAKNDDPALFAEAVRRWRAAASICIPRWRGRSRSCAPARNADAISSLSPRELEILRLLAAGRTMAQIADLLTSPTRPSPTTAPSSSRSSAPAPPWT